MSILVCRDQTLDLHQPAIMGILNVTPDSFSDGGLWLDTDVAVAHARQMLRDGAAVIDIGGESTRPGAEPVNADQECQRVLPVIAAIIEQVPEAILSIDTSKPAVMQAAVEAGVHMINDVNALQTDGALQVAADSDCAVCLMHMQGEPRSMQNAPVYDNVVEEVRIFLQQRITACLSSGISQNRIMIDPGFGFGKSLQHNLDLLKHIDTFSSLGCPVLVGLSRKSMFAKLIPALAALPADSRVHASTAAAAAAVEQGARVIRTHDVVATRDVLLVMEAVQLSDRNNTVK